MFTPLKLEEKEQNASLGDGFRVVILLCATSIWEDCNPLTKHLLLVS